MGPSLRHLGLAWRHSALLTALAMGFSLSGCGGSGSDCGGPFCFGPAAPRATTLAIGSGDGQTGAPGRPLAQPIEVLVTGDEGDPIQDVVVAFSVGTGAGSLSDPETRSDHQGRARVNWTLGPQTGAQSVQASASDSGSPLTGSPLTFSAQAVRAPPARIVLRLAPPDAVRNGVPFEQQPVAEVLDADDQPVSAVQVIASIASGGGTLSGTTGVASNAVGQAVYTDLAILGSSGPRTVRFSVADPALEVVSGAIQVTAGAPAAIAGVAPLTYEGTVKSPVSPAPSVTVKDAAGTGVPGVSVSFSANRDASVSPETVTTDELGVAQVTSWTLGGTANVQNSLTARVESSGLPPVVFSATPRAGAAGRLTIAVQPSTPAQNGTPFAQQPVIQVVDQSGNPAPQPAITIAATVSSGPSGELLNATATTDASGRAAFTGLILNGAVGNYTVSFSAQGLTGANSIPISLTIGPPAKLALATSLSPTTRSRVPLAPQPSIQVQDAGGNAVAQPGIVVAASVATGGGTLNGQATATTDGNGLAAFSDLAISGGPGSQTLSFASTSPPLQGPSAQVTLPSVASVAVQTPAPSSATVGTPLSGAPSWILQDGAGLPVADAPVGITASSGGSVVPGSTTSDGNGIVQVQSWTLGTGSGDQFLEIKVGDTGPTSQVHLSATAGGATQMQKVSGDNQEVSPPLPLALPDPLVVRVMDQYGNGVGGVTVQWRACDGSGNYDPVTDIDGFSSSSQPIGTTPGTFCAQASASANGTALGGSPVEFTYTVKSSAGASSQLRTNESSVAKPGGLPPVAPASPTVRRPSVPR